MRELFELVEDPVSLETPVGDGESMVADLIEDEKSESPDGATADNARSAELHAGDRAAEPAHAARRRCGASGSTASRRRRSKRSGRDLGITRERVRQLETRALRELRTVAPGLQLYLHT